MVALFLLVTILIMMTTIALIGKFNQWFSDKNEYYSEFKKRSDIKVGTPVIFKENEWPIGSVVEFDINKKNNKVKVWYKVLKEYEDKIRYDSKATLTKGGGLGIGNAIIEISIGTEKASIVANKDPIEVKPGSEDNLIANIKRTFAKEADLAKTITHLKGISKQLKEGEGILKINDLIGDLNKEIKLSMVKVQKSLNDVNNISGNIDDLVVTNKTQINDTIASVSYDVKALVTNVARAITLIITKIERRTDPILDETQGAVTVALKDLTSAVNVITKSIEKDVPKSITDVRKILQNLKLVTIRVNELLNKVEGLVSSEKKARPVLIDHIEREDY